MAWRSNPWSGGGRRIRRSSPRSTARAVFRSAPVQRVARSAPVRSNAGSVARQVFHSSGVQHTARSAAAPSFTAPVNSGLASTLKALAHIAGYRPPDTHVGTFFTDQGIKSLGLDALLSSVNNYHLFKHPDSYFWDTKSGWDPGSTTKLHSPDKGIGDNVHTPNKSPQASLPSASSRILEGEGARTLQTASKGLLAGQAIGDAAALAPKAAPKPPPLAPISASTPQAGTTYKARLFAHPGRPGQPPQLVKDQFKLTKNIATGIAAGMAGIGGNPTATPAPRSAVQKKLAHQLWGIGYSQKQIGHALSVPGAQLHTTLKKLGTPQNLLWAQNVLKGVNTAAGAVVPQNKSHYSPADISKMAQAHGAPKWLADALGRTSVSESGGNPRAVSNSAGGGSRGLLQINPAAWGAVHQHGDLYNPDYNIRSALYVISQSGSGAWSGSGTWHDRPVAAGQFKFPPPWQQKAAVAPQKLNPQQQHAVLIAKNAAKWFAGSGSGQAPVPHKVPAAIRAMLGHVPTYNTKAALGPTLHELPHATRHFLQQFMPQAHGAVSSPGVTSGVTSGVSAPSVANPVSGVPSSLAPASTGAPGTPGSAPATPAFNPFALLSALNQFSEPGLGDPSQSNWDWLSAFMQDPNNPNIVTPSSDLELLRRWLGM